NGAAGAAGAKPLKARALQAPLQPRHPSEVNLPEGWPMRLSEGRKRRISAGYGPVGRAGRKMLLPPHKSNRDDCSRGTYALFPSTLPNQSNSFGKSGGCNLPNAAFEVVSFPSGGRESGPRGGGCKTS